MKKWIVKKLLTWLVSAYKDDESLSKIMRELITEVFDWQHWFVRSEIRKLQADVSCLNGSHDYDQWSCIAQKDLWSIKNIDGQESYRYRACRNCRKEMPESRIYNKFNAEKNEWVFDRKEKNAKEFSETQL